MNLFNKLYQEFKSFLNQEFQIKELPHFTFELNTNSENIFGDISSNIAMLLAKELKKSPKDIANQIIEKFKNRFINRIELAGPGFLNFFLTNEAFTELLRELMESKEEFFKNNNKKFNYNIEFLSANRSE